MTEQRHKDIVAKADAAFAQNDLERFLALCTDDIHWTMVGDRSVSGKDAIRGWMASMPTEPPQFAATAVVAEADYVVAYGDMRMKEQGQDVPYSYCDVYRFRGERIAELRSYVIKTANAQV